MSAQHTPGPWRWELNLKSKCIELAGGRPQFDKTAMDFARLIASAPTLLSALQLIASAQPSEHDLAYCQGIARAALAKAEGRTP